MSSVYYRDVAVDMATQFKCSICISCPTFPSIERYRIHRRRYHSNIEAKSQNVDSESNVYPTLHRKYDFRRDEKAVTDDLTKRLHAVLQKPTKSDSVIAEQRRKDMRSTVVILESKREREAKRITQSGLSNEIRYQPLSKQGDLNIGRDVVLLKSQLLQCEQNVNENNITKSDSVIAEQRRKDMRSTVVIQESKRERETKRITQSGLSNEIRYQPLSKQGDLNIGREVILLKSQLLQCEKNVIENNMKYNDIKQKVILKSNKMELIESELKILQVKVKNITIAAQPENEEVQDIVILKNKQSISNEESKQNTNMANFRKELIVKDELIENLRLELESLKDQNKTKETYNSNDRIREIQILKEKVEDAKVEKVKMEEMLDEKTKIIENVNIEKETLTTDCDLFYQKIMEKYDGMSKDYITLKTELVDSGKTIAESGSMIVELKDELKHEIEKSKKMQTQQLDLFKEVDKLERTVLENEDTIEKMKRDLHTKVKEVTELKGKLDDGNDEKLSLTTKYENISAALNKSELSLKEALSNNNIDGHQELIDEIDELKRMLGQAEEQNVSHQTVCSELIKTGRKLEEALAKDVNKTQALKLTILKHQEILDLKEEQNVALATKSENFCKALEKTGKDLEDALSNCANGEQILTTMKMKLEETEKQKNLVESEYKKLKNQLSKKDKALPCNTDVNKNKFDELQSKYENIQKDFDLMIKASHVEEHRTGEENNKMQNEINSLRDSIAIKDEELIKYQGEIEGINLVKDDLKDKQSLIGELNIDIEQLSKEANIFRDEAEELRIKLNLISGNSNHIQNLEIQLKEVSEKQNAADMLNDKYAENLKLKENELIEIKKQLDVTLDKQNKMTNGYDNNLNGEAVCHDNFDNGQNNDENDDSSSIATSSDHEDDEENGIDFGDGFEIPDLSKNSVISDEKTMKDELSSGDATQLVQKDTDTGKDQVTFDAGNSLGELQSSNNDANSDDDDSDSDDENEIDFGDGFEIPDLSENSVISDEKTTKDELSSDDPTQLVQKDTDTRKDRVIFDAGNSLGKLLSSNDDTKSDDDDSDWGDENEINFGDGFEIPDLSQNSVISDEKTMKDELSSGDATQLVQKDTDTGKDRVTFDAGISLGELQSSNNDANSDDDDSDSDDENEIDFGDGFEIPDLSQNSVISDEKTTKDELSSDDPTQLVQKDTDTGKDRVAFDAGNSLGGLPSSNDDANPDDENEIDFGDGFEIPDLSENLVNIYMGMINNKLPSDNTSQHVQKDTNTGEDRPTGNPLGDLPRTMQNDIGKVNDHDNNMDTIGEEFYNRENFEDDDDGESIAESYDSEDGSDMSDFDDNDIALLLENL